MRVIHLVIGFLPLGVQGVELHPELLGIIIFALYQAEFNGSVLVLFMRLKMCFLPQEFDRDIEGCVVCAANGSPILGWSGVRTGNRRGKLKKLPWIHRA